MKHCSDNSLVKQVLVSPTSWQKSLQEAVTDFATLYSLLKLEEVPSFLSQQADQQFPLRVPREFIKRMRIGDPHDPLLLQILPQGREMEIVPGYSTDPLAEKSCNPIPGLLHKYHGRVLLIPASTCAINCRYCFRRNFPYEANTVGRSKWRYWFDYITARPEITEVILSGGDPLIAPDHYLKELIEQLAQLPQLITLRIHTRLPVVIPSRITSELLNLFNSLNLKTVMVIHCNHPNEIDNEMIKAFATLREAKVTLLNQAVLLKNINDTLDTQIRLNTHLFEAGVLPYYLHLLDQVKGTAHFFVNEKEARILMRQLQAKLPGYLVPKLVREIPGHPNKTWIAVN